MLTNRTMSLSRVLPSTVFDQLSFVIQQMAQEIDSQALVLTEAVLPGNPAFQAKLERFVLVVSDQFSGLLLAETPPADEKLLESSVGPSFDDARYQVGLTFAPEALAAFLTELRGQLPSTALNRLELAGQHLGPNDATIQSEFTLRLIDVLSRDSTPPLEASCDPFVAAALRQQVEQEQLLNQVATQIRRSMELPVILKTAVQEVQTLLDADRVVIYEFNPTKVINLEASGETVTLPVAKPLSDRSVSHTSWSTASTLSAGLNGSSSAIIGRITYEARAEDSIPSVLDLVEGMDCFANSLKPHEKYQKGFALAIDDIEATYALSPCLLNLLRQTKVRAKLVVPIVVQEEPWGLLIVHQCNGIRQWQDREKVFLQRIAEHLAIALWQAKLYAQLQQQKQMLEQRVVERTQELHDTLLAAQSASRAKTEFLAAMSHELRTPLTCVIGMAETLLRTMSAQPGTYSIHPQKQQDYLKTIKKSGEHLLELINDILDVSQVEAGKTVLNVSEFSLSQLAYQSLYMLREKAHSKGVELSIDLKTEPESFNNSLHRSDTFVADRRRVSQILLNLLSNAVKFTPEGGRVTLRVTSEQNNAIFQVEDTGIGISESQRPLLFQKFQQLDSSYHRRYEGTGLGLALTKQLVELHGGIIEVSSVEGKGSTFTVWLPAQSLGRGDSSTKVSSDSSTPVEPIDETVVSSYTITLGGQVVLIENHEETAMLVCDLLTAAGCQVIWMIDGMTAVKQIEMLQPSLVITDIQLPGMDGYEIMKFLRQHPNLQQTKILALTARVMPEERDRCFAEGADDYLAKPVQPYQLLDKVVALVGEGERGGRGSV